MALAKRCSVCASGYRGLFMLHVASKGHQRKEHPTPKRTWSKGKERGRQAGRILRYDPSVGKVKVDRYRRRRPLDGPKKDVHVTDYFRDRPSRVPSYGGFVPDHHYVTPAYLLHRPRS